MSELDLAGKLLNIGWKRISVATTNNVLVAGVAGYRIRVLGLVVQSAAGTFDIRDSANTVIIGPLLCTDAAETLSCNLTPSVLGYGEAALGLDLEIEISGTDANIGCLTYCFVKE